MLSPSKHNGTPASARQWLLAQPFAHRGLHDLSLGIPENSLASFEAAIEEKVGIELDVRVADDGVAMVFHDPVLDYLTRGHGPIEQLPSFEIEKYNVLETQEHIPTLRAALDLIRGRVPVLIEIKSESPIRRRIISAVRHALEGYKGHVGVMSFDPEVPRWFSQQDLPWNYGLVLTAHPSYKKSWATRSKLARRIVASRSKAQFFATDIRDLPCGFIRHIRKKNYVTLGWTVRTEKDFHLTRSHLDNVIFEKP